MTADQIYVDPSAIISLYVHEGRSLAMARWRRRIRGTLPITHHGRIEVVNGIALAVFRGMISLDDAREGWRELDEDLADGHLGQVDLLWRATLNRAAELSRTHTATVGARSLDILHVSAAHELGLRWFLGFDQRQNTLARLTGLKVIEI